MKYCLLFLFSALMFVSCTKVEQTPSKQEKMRASDWTIDTLTVTYLTSTGADSEVISLWKRFESGQDVFTKPDCLKDDFLKFRQNFLGSHISGTVKCGTNETSDMEFSWGLREAETKIYIYGAYALFGQDVNADMIYFQDDKFEFAFPKRMQTSGTDSTTVKITCRLKKK